MGVVDGQVVKYQKRHGQVGGDGEAEYDLGYPISDIKYSRWAILLLRQIARDSEAKAAVLSSHSATAVTTRSSRACGKYHPLLQHNAGAIDLHVPEYMLGQQERIEAIAMGCSQQW
jgi:hypothetical protein